MNKKFERRMDALSAEVEQAESFLNQTKKLMLDALDHDLSQEHNLNNAIATFEELRNRARNAMELRRAYKLMETVRETE
ncbi:MAG: hypothetical protein J6N51_13455 [Selenomonas sp.]|nr:hypothetical protein [Selenomonas sp.]